ncbi:hypothetical protein BH10BAC2_BH10BAC2_02200 [soil metagenome]
MVKIIGTKSQLNDEGKSFVSFKLQGDVEAIQSQKTGRMYLTAKTCYIACTFDEKTATSLLGTSLPGTIERVSCVPYEYTVKETGEVLSLVHTYEYVPVAGREEGSSAQRLEILTYEEVEP